MSWQTVISLITLGMAVASAIGIYAWRGGEWTGVERRSSEEVQRRMDQASEELSKLTGKLQALILLSSDVKVLEAKFEALEQRVLGSEGIEKRLYDVATKCQNIETLKNDLEHCHRRLQALEHPQK